MRRVEATKPVIDHVWQLP